MASSAIGCDNWEVKAVQEQFHIFDSLTVPYEILEAKGNNKLGETINNILKKHWKLNKSPPSSLFGHVSESVTKTALTLCTLRNENIFKLSFVVIVTNQPSFPEGLCKVPVFIITLGNASVYIDVESKIFQSWDALMQQKTLPECKFCFPANGLYNVGGELKIDFGTSAGTTQNLVKTSMFHFVVGCVIDAGKVAASCLIKISEFCIKIIYDLKPIAEQFITRMYSRERDFLQLGLLFYQFKNGSRSVFDLMLSSYHILVPLCEFIAKEVSRSWKYVKTSLSEAYEMLKELFPQFFNSASESSQHELLALTERVDSEVVEVNREADRMISEAYRCTSGSAVTDLQDNIAHRQRVFGDCVKETALMSSLKISTFEETTNDLLNLTKHIVNDKKGLKSRDLKELFESISFNVFEEYKMRMKIYTQSIVAATKATKGTFNLSAFNKNLGIKGDPKVYYMKEVLQSVESSLRLNYKVDSKAIELRKKSEIILIPLWKKENDNEPEGIYKCIGVRGAGEFSSQDLLDVIGKKFGILVQSAVNEANMKGLTSIHSKELRVLVTQKVNEENTSEGLVFFERN